MRIADDRIRSDQNGVAVRLASSGAFNSNIPVRACSVLNKDLLAKAAREVVRDEASCDIGRPACCKRNHDADGPIWPVLRPDYWPLRSERRRQQICDQSSLGAR